MGVRQSTYDAIVVGSGITGGWAAKELTEAGLNTLVLEAGRSIDPATDYAEHEPSWNFRFRGLGNRKNLAERQPVQRTCYACDEAAAKFFVDDVDNPYSTPDGKPFLWIRGRQVGGKSIMWARMSYRWSDLDFEANLRDGYGVDWPIRYADLEPWYDHVERFAGISGEALGLDQLPDSRFLPPMPLNCAEEFVKAGVERQFGRERVVTIGRSAILTVNHNSRPACHYCGPCHRGCITRSYFSSLNATLPAAEATGRMTLRPNSVVAEILYDPDNDRARGVRVIDAVTSEDMEFEGRMVFLCASALESTRLLLNSKSVRFPNGLGNSSGELGHNLMDHTMRSGAVGMVPGLDDRNAYGNRPTGVYVPRFRNVWDEHPDFLRGYGFQGSAGRAGWGRGVGMPGFGAEFKEALREPGPWRMSFGGFGECLPRHSNYVEIDPEKKDKWGVPVLRIHCEWSDNELAMLQDMSVTAAEMLEAAGCTDITPYRNEGPPGLTIHEMGTARMGRDPQTSVLNGYNQCHDVPNLFVTDGASMASTACQNPSLTYMALTARACAYAVEQLQRREL
jgi:choline dehydrogenase-like flavoprotein